MSNSTSKIIKPNFLIAGASKSGTTSVFTYLSKHPDVCASAIKETQFFWNLAIGKDLPALEKYSSYFDYRGEKIIMESSPSYLYGEDILVSQVHNLIPDCKILFILREPIERLFSYYKHLKRNNVINASLNFQSFYSRSIEIYNNEERNFFYKNRNPIARGVRGGYYELFLRHWFDYFDNTQIRIIFFDDLVKDTENVISNICEWLAIDQSFFKGLNFSQENKSIEVKNPRIHQLVSSVLKKNEHFFRKFPLIKSVSKKIYFNLNSSDKRGQKISDDDRFFLQSHYKISNMNLKYLLINKGYSKLPSWVDL